MTTKVTVDDDRWPVLVVTQRVDQLSDSERLASLEICSNALNAHGLERYAMILDNRKAGPMPATQRRMMADYMEKHAMRARARCVCTAMVMDSAVMRAMLTAILWLRRPEVETQVFGELDEAITWARHKFEAASSADAGDRSPAR